MQIFAAILSFSLIVSTACTQKPEVPRIGKKNSGNVGGEGYDSDGNSNGTKDPSNPVPAAPTELQLANDKFKGEEGKLEALITYAGTKSERLKLSASSNAAMISIPKLAAGKEGTLVVELFEGDKLRFKAIRLNTEVIAGKEHSFAIEDCHVQKLPWDGEKHESLCGWSIENAKN